jgi:hypothetical protein
MERRASGLPQRAASCRTDLSAAVSSPDPGSHAPPAGQDARLWSLDIPNGRIDPSRRDGRRQPEVGALRRPPEPRRMSGGTPEGGPGACELGDSPTRPERRSLLASLRDADSSLVGVRGSSLCSGPRLPSGKPPALSASCTFLVSSTEYVPPKDHFPRSMQIPPVDEWAQVDRKTFEILVACRAASANNPRSVSLNRERGAN